MLTLLDPAVTDSCVRRLACGRPVTEVPVRMEGHVACVEARIGTHTLRLGIDCGAGTDLLDDGLWDSLRSDLVRRRETTLTGADAEVRRVRSGRVKRLTIGDREFRRVPTVFNDMSHLNLSLGHGLDGLIGFPVLSAQRTVLSYRSGRLIFPPEAGKGGAGLEDVASPGEGGVRPFRVSGEVRLRRRPAFAPSPAGDRFGEGMQAVQPEVFGHAPLPNGWHSSRRTGADRWRTGRCRPRRCSRRRRAGHGLWAGARRCVPAGRSPRTGRGTEGWRRGSPSARGRAESGGGAARRRCSGCGRCPDARKVGPFAACGERVAPTVRSGRPVPRRFAASPRR